MHLWVACCIQQRSCIVDLLLYGEQAVQGREPLHTGCDMGAGDNLVRDTTGGVHSHPATKQCSGLVQDIVVLENVK